MKAGVTRGRRRRAVCVGPADVTGPSGFPGAPSMGAILEVQVLPRADHSERSETQLREGDRAWEGSVNRNREPMDKNCIRGVVKQGERARKREALVVKARWRRCGGCAGKDRVLTWGDLASCLKGRRACPEREVSRGRSSRSRVPSPESTTKGRTRGTVTRREAWQGIASDAGATRGRGTRRR